MGKSLRIRSSGAPTAGHQARAGGTLYIFTGPGLASCRCRPLSSNVRHHKMRCVPSAAQNSRMHPRLYSSHPSLAVTGEVSRLRLNMLDVRCHSKNCSKKLRASRVANVVPETVVVVQFTKPAAGARLQATFHVGTGGRRVTFKASRALAPLGSRGEKTVTNPSSVASSYAVMPNTSLEARPNGRPPGPAARYGVHFLSSGPGVLPLVPPQLKR